MRRIIIIIACALLHILQLKAQLVDWSLLYDADSCYSLCSSDRIGIQRNINRLNDNRHSFIISILDSLDVEFNDMDTLYVFESISDCFHGFYYKMNILTDTTVFCVEHKFANRKPQLTKSKIKIWNPNNRMDEPDSENLLSYCKEMFKTHIDSVYRWMEDSYENTLDSSSYMLCTLFIKQQENYRIERYSFWSSWLWLKMKDIYNRRWYPWMYK